jgi:hypothetical protein
MAKISKELLWCFWHAHLKFWRIRV